MTYTFVVFTHGDKLQNRSIEQLIRQNEELSKLKDECGGRFHLLNNKEPSNREQVTKLLEKIHRKVFANENNCYTLEMLSKAQQKPTSAEIYKARMPVCVASSGAISRQDSTAVGLRGRPSDRLALLPKQIVYGEENHPYAQRTDLGWSIVGCSYTANDYSDVAGISHRTLVRQVVPDIEPSVKLKREVHFVCRIHVKEIIPTDIIKALESDFTDHCTDNNSISQEDILFLSKVKESIRQKENGHYELPLPFKTDKPSLPDNKQCAVHRLNSLERRLRKVKQYHDDYVSFMNEIITRGDAEKVPIDELQNQPAWYIPHHGVYHPHKPGKICVVFDCSARFHDTSLNDHLLTGPDLTNTLVGVLCRFRKGPIAIMCDVERMFHQFHVAKEHQDFLRFLWWDEGNLDSKPSVYRMKVHLFGAASSPGCSNFGFKYLASQGHGRFSEESIKFIQRSFYVDDGLTSVKTPAEAIHLVEEARALCRTGNLWLHKFVSNSEEVITTIPPEECAQTKDLDMAIGELHME
nr:uncharacterized protein LOC129426212 [Misgurnus anguillicaudatus]